MLMLGNAVDDGLAVKGSSDRDISGVYLSKKEWNGIEVQKRFQIQLVELHSSSYET